MANQSISRPEQKCISRCIMNYWGPNSEIDPKNRADDNYKQCLTDCNICS